MRVRTAGSASLHPRLLIARPLRGRSCGECRPHAVTRYGRGGALHCRHQKCDPYGVVISGGIGAAGSPSAHPVRRFAYGSPAVIRSWTLWGPFVRRLLSAGAPAAYPVRRFAFGSPAVIKNWTPMGSFCEAIPVHGGACLAEATLYQGNTREDATNPQGTNDLPTALNPSKRTSPSPRPPHIRGKRQAIHHGNSSSCGAPSGSLYS